MNSARILAVAAVWAASLVGVGLWAQGRGVEPQPAPVIEMDKPFGPIITGQDIGFQRIGPGPDRDGKITGVWKVRVNGEWFEVKSQVKTIRTN